MVVPKSELDSSKADFVRIAIRVVLVALLFTVHFQRNSGGQLTETEGPSVDQTAAVEHFRAGVTALQSGDVDRAVSELEKAIVIQPETDEFHAAICAAHLARKDKQRAWESARMAHQFGPENPRVVNQFAIAWSAVGDELFKTGRTSDAIEGALGAPDRVNPSGSNERWIYGCMALDFAKGELYSTIDLRGYTPSLQQHPIRLGFRPDPALWKVKTRRVDRFAATTEYASRENESDLLITQRIYLATQNKQSPRRWMESARDRSTPSGGALDWVVTSEDVYGITYRWRHDGAADGTPHWELTRVLKGARDLHRVSYISQGPGEPANAERWQKQLSELRLVKRKHNS